MDFAVIEHKWQEKWKKERVFEPKLDSKKKKFFFTVPFPYTSGALHVGHGRTFTTGDFIARFKRKMGFNVLWPMGFHRTGTPILAISDKIKQGDEATIKLFTEYVMLKEKDSKKIKSIVKSFEDPENVANYFADMIEDGFNEIGLSVDWTRKFKTGEDHFNKFVEWQYSKFMEAGVLVKGKHPVVYCVNDKNAVGEDDIKDGDTDSVDVNEFISLKFKLGDKYLAASTLRPETIYGVTNLWVNPEKVYAEVEMGNEIYIVSSEAVEKLRYQVPVLRVLREFPGSELIGKTVVTPLGTEVPVLPGSFVNPDTATGVVYSVPAHAPFDYVALRDLQSSEELMRKYGLNVKDVRSIKPVLIIDIKDYKREPAIEVVESLHIKSQAEAEAIEQATKQVYKDEFYSGILNKKCAEFAGIKINEIKKKVIDKLLNEKKAFKFYETSRKAFCRCGGKILVAVLDDQWFLDYTGKEWKDKTRGLVNEMSVVPEKYRKLFLDTFDWLEKRPCARKRGIGTKLPYDKNWIIESLSDSTVYMAFYTVASVISRNKIPSSKLTPEVFDYVFLGKGKSPAKWADEMRDEFTYWYPLDHRHTAPAHISNHLTFFLFHHTLIFPKKYWPKAMSFNEMLIREGVKMSKSKGNIIPLQNVSREYGTDLYHMFVLTSSELDSVVDWKEKELLSVKSKLAGFANTAFEACNVLPAKKFSSIDLWIRSRFYSRLKDAIKSADDMKIRSYGISIFFEFLNELSYYRKRVSNEEFNSVIRSFLPDWIIALEPLIPHLAEELWSKLGNKGFVSLEEFPKIKDSFINSSIEQSESVVMSTLSDINQLLDLVKTVPKKISLFVSDAWKYDLFKIVVKSSDKHDFKKLISESMKSEEVKRNGKDAIRIIEGLVKNPSRVPFAVPDRDNEYKSLNEAIDFFRNEFKCEFDVVKDSLQPKAKSALPGKPGILIE